MAVELERVRARLSARGVGATPASVAEALEWLGHVVSDAGVLATLEALRRESRGAGPLDDLLREPGVTDVVVNGPEAVFVDRGAGLERVPLRFASDEEVRRLAVRLAAQVGRRLDDGHPFVDARLPDGTRVHAVLGCLADAGTCLSLRIPSRTRLALADWVANGSLSPAGRDLLSGLVERRRAYLVSGGTGSGKTTLLGSLLGEVPARERLVVVEDSRELAPDHPHCVRLEARPANAEGMGQVTLTDLVRQALRMRPDRLIVGEVRGAELADLLAALNTGHEGGCGTLHANGVEAVPARLEALGALGGLGRLAVHAQAVAALDAVVQLRRERGGGRRFVAEIATFDSGPDGLVRVQPAACFDESGRLVRGPGFGRLERLVA